MSEIRQDPTTGSFVIIAPERGARPGASPRSPGRGQSGPRYDERCPFCPGNEAQLPGIIAETPAHDPPGWAVRVVPNRFPALAPEPSNPCADAAHMALPGYGVHEVIIECPRHDADLAMMEARQIATVVASCHRRFSELSGRPGIEVVVLFSNHGARSGASLAHPHAQAIALPLLPPKLRAIAEWAERKGAQTSRCPTCAELERELSAGERIIEESRNIVALVPYAAEHPCEQWLVPKRHQASFAEATEEELADLAVLLGSALRRLKAVHGDPPYNFAIESWRSVSTPYVHWRLRIVPDLVNWGGFERGSGMAINPSAPEDDAALLRASLGESSEPRKAKT